jgi:hypothetical protein
MSEATSYVARMIAFSEPVGSASADNEAFAEAARELSYDEPDDSDSDPSY